MNILKGTGLGAAGQAGANIIGHGLRPVQSQLPAGQQQLAQRAQALGIPLDLADLTGSRPLKTIRSVLLDMPLTADAQAAAQTGKQNAFNRAVGDTFGSPADKLTPDVLQTARNRIGGEIGNIANRNNLNAQGTTLLNDLGQAQAEVNRFGMPEVTRVVNNRIDDLLSKVDANGMIPGQAYREFDSAIGRTLRTTTNGDLRNYLGEVRHAARNAMDQSISQADQQAWQQARREYANLMTVAPLAAKTAEGDVSGRGLLGAVSNANRSTFPFGGGGDLGELGRIGRSFVMDPIQNSGTPARGFWQDFLNHPVGALWRGGVGGLTVPAQTLLNSQNPLAVRYLTQGLLPVNAEAQAVMNHLGRNAAPMLPALAYPAQQ
jgi:hypothetical protein